MLRQVDRWPDDGHLGGSVGETGRGIGEVEFPWLHGDFGVDHLEMADQPEQQVGTGSDQVAQPDAAVVRRDRDEVVDGRVDAASASRTLGSQAAPSSVSATSRVLRVNSMTPS